MSKEKKNNGIVKLSAEDHIELAQVWTDLEKIQYQVQAKQDKIALNTETIKRIQAENGIHQRDINALNGLFNTTKVKSQGIWQKLSDKYGVNMLSKGAYDPITWTWKSEEAIEVETKGGNQSELDALDALDEQDGKVDKKEVN